MGIIIFNDVGQLLWAKRLGQDAWQFPQGGVQRGESAEDALMRELDEEVGLAPGDVNVVASTREWLPYRLPAQYIRQNSHPVCIGQKQKWFLLKLLSDPERIQLDRGDRPEFDHWRWVSYWYPLNQVIDFKRDVYRQALLELNTAFRDALGAGR